MSVINQIQTMKLADQINDEFLTCKICFEHYKDPKCLTCLHTFCEECIEHHVQSQRSYKYTDYREFACPICRKKTVIPSGGVHKLNDNFLISSLNELLIAQKPSKIPMCDICALVNQREREATSKCVECQKSMCRPCAKTHSQMKITINHSIYELEIEKDIFCKKHIHEQVRYYCEECDICVCLACMHTEHRDHELVDFKDGISHHKDKIEENLRKCREKIAEVQNRVNLVNECENRMASTQNEIHSVVQEFIKAIKDKEKCLIDELNEFYGEECLEYIKKKDEMEAFLDQLNSTCNLTDMVVKGKDIEMLLLKKQLCDKFDEFEEIHLEPVPKNLIKNLFFESGYVDVGKLTENKTKPISDVTTSISSTPFGSNSNGDIDSDQNDYEEDETDQAIKKAYLIELNSKSTQINHRDMRQIMGDGIRETEVQTDIRMIHDLVPPSKIEVQRLERRNTIRQDSKETQTDEQASPSNMPLSSEKNSSRGVLSSQSSLDDDPSVPVDRVKLGRRVRRHVKPGCAIAVAPNSEIIIIDPEANSMTILDRRGKFRYGLSNSNKPCNESGHQGTSTLPGNSPKLDRGLRINTPQGTLVIKLEPIEPLVRTELANNHTNKSYEN